MIDGAGLLAHATAVVVGDRGILIIGPSGSGKSSDGLQLDRPGADQRNICGLDQRRPMPVAGGIRPADLHGSGYSARRNRGARFRACTRSIMRTAQSYTLSQNWCNLIVPFGLPMKRKYNSKVSRSPMLFYHNEKLKPPAAPLRPGFLPNVEKKVRQSNWLLYYAARK